MLESWIGIFKLFHAAIFYTVVIESCFFNFLFEWPRQHVKKKGKKKKTFNLDLSKTIVPYNSLKTITRDLNPRKLNIAETSFIFYFFY